MQDKSLEAFRRTTPRTTLVTEKQSEDINDQTHMAVYRLTMEVLGQAVSAFSVIERGVWSILVSLLRHEPVKQSEVLDSGMNFSSRVKLMKRFLNHYHPDLAEQTANACDEALRLAKVRNNAAHNQVWVVGPPSGQEGWGARFMHAQRAEFIVIGDGKDEPNAIPILLQLVDDCHDLRESLAALHLRTMSALARAMIEGADSEAGFTAALLKTEALLDDELERLEQAQLKGEEEDSPTRSG